MALAKPTLGYPSRTAAVVALTGEGLSTREVAARIGISVEAVAAYRSNARRRRISGDQRGPSIPREILAELAPAAAVRGMAAGDLAWRLLSVIVADDLVDAVLDEPRGGGR